MKDPQSEREETNAESLISNKYVMQFKLNLPQKNFSFGIIHYYS